MNDKIGNSIVKHQLIINELKQIKERVSKNIDKKVKAKKFVQKSFN